MKSPFRRWMRPTLLMCLFAVAARQLNSFSWQAGGITILWPCNALLMGILVCAPRYQWPMFIGLAATIDLVVNVSLGNAFPVSLYVTGCNTLEGAGAAFLLHGTMAGKPDLTEPKQFVRFLICGVLLLPLITSVLAPFASSGKFGAPSIHGVLGWFAADALGAATVAPLYLSWHKTERLVERSTAETLGWFALLTAITAVTFWQTQFPLLFLVLPTLFVVGVRLGLAASALGLLLVTLIGGFFTVAGHGPLGLMHGSLLPFRENVFQIFILISMLLLYVTELQTTESRRLQAGLQGSERRFRLLAEASSDIIVLTNLEGVREYVSPAAYEVLGWTPEQVLGRRVGDLAHPEDRPAIQELFDACRNGASARSLDYRCRKIDGSYIWLETSPRLFRDAETGEPAGFVSVTRDISLRKQDEEEQRNALEEAERLASVDGLTGIANRRQFDRVLEREWLRSAREQTSLSLLLLDVDRFKAYNDLYGHQRGDECLRQVASALRLGTRRPADMLARYGGEEFALLLPSTGALGALQLAEGVRSAVEGCSLPHSGNPPFGIVTISIGCASVTPQSGASADALVEFADRALYRAKESGRNQVQETVACLAAAAATLAG